MEAAITRRCFTLAALSFVARAQKTVFDDEGFAGWQSFGGGSWTAEDNELIGRFGKNRPGPGYIFTRDLFTDFRLALLFQISSGGRSAIYFREPRRKWGLDGENRPGTGSGGGYEVLIDYQDADNPTGTISNVQRSKKTVGGEEQWNELEIICRGSDVRISIARQNINHFSQLRAQAGVIGFGVPSPVTHDIMVRFRNIVISSMA